MTEAGHISLVVYEILNHTLPSAPFPLLLSLYNIDTVLVVFQFSLFGLIVHLTRLRCLRYF